MAKKKSETEIGAPAAIENTAPVTESSLPEVSKKKGKAGAKMENELQAPVSTGDNADSGKKTKKAAKKQSDKPNIFKRMWKGIKGVISELKKVTWPKAKDVSKNTAVVLVVVVAFFLVLFAIDYVLSGILSLIVSNEWAFIFIS